MKDILFFSHNQKKIVEVKQIFKDSKIKVYDLNAFEKIKDPKETGATFSSNAKIKSKYGQKLFNMPCFADDSGFCVEALKNNPGVKSKRFLEKFSNNKKALLFFFLTTFEIIYSKAALLLENFSKNLSDFTPGFFFRASTQKPESSAKQGILNNF